MPTESNHPETMLFKAPGPCVWEGMEYEYIVVPAADVEAKLAEGWFLTVPEAAAAVRTDTETKLKANQAEQDEIAAKLASNADAPKLTPVHKGRGVWSLVDAEGVEVKTGLTKEQAHA